MRKVIDRWRMVHDAPDVGIVHSRLFFFFIMGWLTNALAINALALLYAPLELLTSRWEIFIVPVSIVGGLIVSVGGCRMGLSLRCRRIDS
ncbi:MAG: hypothetical protein HDS57_03090 [Barnesiella sp.]|nr:hypothetical protein [Barnesiella sp.]